MHHPFRLHGPCLADWSSSTKHQKQEVERKPLLATQKKKSKHILQTTEGKHAPHFLSCMFYFGILHLRLLLNFTPIQILTSISCLDQLKFSVPSSKARVLLKQRAFSYYIYIAITTSVDCLTCPKWLKLKQMIPL